MTAKKVAVVVVGAAVVALVVLSPVRRWALALVEWVQGQGAVAALLYGAVYVVAAVLLIPGLHRL